MSATPEPLVTVEVDGALATFTLNRPEKRNAISLRMVATLAAAIEQLADEVKVELLRKVLPTPRVVEVAWDLKRKRALGESHALLRDKVLAMLFFFTSTRTRGSFEAGMAQLGGHAAFIDSETTQISHGDTAKEIGEIFGRYFDGIAIRVPTPDVSLTELAVEVERGEVQVGWLDLDTARLDFNLAAEAR